MSAKGIWERIEELRIRSTDDLAPGFRGRLLTGLGACQGRLVEAVLPGDAGVVTVVLDPIIEETLRVDELQRIYFSQGTTKAQSAKYGWHFYGLAADVISKKYGWFTDRIAIAMFPNCFVRKAVSRAWFGGVAGVLKQYGLKWGGDWEHPDEPHFYFGTLKATPSDRARELYDAVGRDAVWKEVGADENS